jgi:hypothetical protein
MEESTQSLILAVDPGRAKLGLAVMNSSGLCLLREVVLTPEALGRIQEIVQTSPISQLVIGDRTGHEEALSLVEPTGLPVERISEHHTTLLARKLYWRDHPPRGWRRLVPQGLLTPNEPLDGYAAEVLALRFLGLMTDSILER